MTPSPPEFRSGPPSGGRQEVRPQWKIDSASGAISSPQGAHGEPLGLPVSLIYGRPATCVVITASELLAMIDGKRGEA